MKFFILTFVAVVIEGSWFTHVSSSLFVPNLLIVLAVFTGFSKKKNDILMLALCAGAVLMDMLSVLPFGSAIFSLIAALSALYFLKSFVPQYTYFYAVIGLCVATLAYWGALWVFIYGVHAFGISSLSVQSLAISIPGIISEIVATFVITTILYPIRSWIIS